MITKESVIKFKQKILTHEGFLKYFKNTSWMLFGQVISMFLSLFVYIILARHLGPRDYGLMSYIMNFCLLFSFIASLGLDSIINRDLVRNPGSYREYLGTGFVLKIFGAIIALAVIYLSSFILSVDLSSKRLILLFSLSFFFQPLNIISLFFQSRVEVKNNTKAQIIYNIFSVSLKALFIFLGLSVSWFVLSYAIDAVILGFSYIYIYKKRGYKILEWRFDNALAKYLLFNSWPFMFSALAVSIYMKIDQIMIGSMIDDSSVGIYAAAAKLSETWYFIPSLICASVFPAIINASCGNQARFVYRLKRLYSLMFWLSLSLALFLTVFSNIIITIVYGSDYLQAASILRVHVWSGIGVFLGVAVTQYLISENYNKILFFMTFVGAIINILLNLLLIPRMGIMGAAVATLVSYSFATIFIIFFKKTRAQIKYMLEGIIFKF